MTDKKFDVYLDLGSSKIRIAAFDKLNQEEIINIEKNCISSLKRNELNLSNTENKIDEIIFDLEKNTGVYLRNINLLLDTQQTLRVSLSVSKNFEGKKIKKTEVEYLIQDAKQQILKSYFDHSIIHIISTNYKLDDQNYNHPPLDIECNKLSFDVIFICFSKEIITKIKNLFHKHEISIDQILCSSYVKSLNYKEQFSYYNNIAFIDVGYEKTSIIVYSSNQLNVFETLPVGANHITKDLSKVLKISEPKAEIIKNSLNEFVSLSKSNENLNIFKSEFLEDFNDKDASLKLINDIIYARVDEILNLSLKSIKLNNKFNEINKFKIVLFGGGSKILDNKNINIKEIIPIFDEITFFEETTQSICESGLKVNQGINNQEVLIIQKKPKKVGFFEKLFYFFR